MIEEKGWQKIKERDLVDVVRLRSVTNEGVQWPQAHFQDTPMSFGLRWKEDWDRDTRCPLWIKKFWSRWRFVHLLSAGPARWSPHMLTACGDKVILKKAVFPSWMIAIIWCGRHVLSNKVLLSGNSMENVKDDDLSPVPPEDCQGLLPTTFCYLLTKSEKSML